MALRCIADDGTDLEASAFDRDEWEALRAQARARRHLHMPVVRRRPFSRPPGLEPVSSHTRQGAGAGGSRRPRSICT